MASRPLPPRGERLPEAARPDRRGLRRRWTSPDPETGLGMVPRGGEVRRRLRPGLAERGAERRLPGARPHPASSWSAPSARRARAPTTATTSTCRPCRRSATSSTGTAAVPSSTSSAGLTLRRARVRVAGHAALVRLRRGAYHAPVPGGGREWRAPITQTRPTRVARSPSSCWWRRRWARTSAPRRGRCGTSGSTGCGSSPRATAGPTRAPRRWRAGRGGCSTGCGSPAAWPRPAPISATSSPPPPASGR